MLAACSGHLATPLGRLGCIPPNPFNSSTAKTGKRGGQEGICQTYRYDNISFIIIITYWHIITCTSEKARLTTLHRRREPASVRDRQTPL